MEKNHVGSSSTLYAYSPQSKTLEAMEAKLFFLLLSDGQVSSICLPCRVTEEASFSCLFLPNGIKLSVCLHSTLFLHTFLF